MKEYKKMQIIDSKVFKNNYIKSNDIKELGSYVYINFNNNKVLFNDLNISKANISRIIYLATYLDNNIEGLLTIQNRDKFGRYTGNEPMTRKQIQSVLGLKNTAFKDFLREIRNNNLIFEKNKKFFLNNQYFIKNNKINKKDKSYCKLFINPIRELYENCEISKHKILANIYMLIPFIYCSNGIICHNPNVTEDKIVPMTLKEIEGLLNYSEGKLKRLKKNLSDFSITIDNENFHIFICSNINNKEFYFINPYILHRSSIHFNSKGEQKISEWLIRNNINFIPQMKYNDLLGLKGGKLRYDFYLPNYNLLIEFQGEQHKHYCDVFHNSIKDFKKQQEHDRRKKQYAKDHNIKLLEIWYYDYNNVEEILQQTLYN